MSTRYKIFPFFTLYEICVSVCEGGGASYRA